MPFECMERLKLQMPTMLIVIDDTGDGKKNTRVVVDCTLIYGGHSCLILDELLRWSSGVGRGGCDDGDADDEMWSKRQSAVLVGLDRDLIELVQGTA